MMEDSHVTVDDQPSDKKHDDAPDHKKSDGESKNASGKEKSLEERAKELFQCIIDTAKKTDKRSILLAKQKLEAQAKEFFRYVVTYMKERAKPDLLLAKQKMELKAKTFAIAVVEMCKKVNKANILDCKEKMMLKSRELIFTAIKLAKTTNYRRMLKKEFRDDVIQRHGRLGMAMLAMFVMVSITFRNDGLDDTDYLMGGVRGRSLAGIPHLPTPKSFEAAEHSLHPKWRLWKDIPEDQHEKALEELVPYFEKYGYLIGNAWTKKHIDDDKICEMVPKAASDVCLFKPSPEGCSFMSFGLSPSGFETSLAQATKCKGFVVDPEASKPTKLDSSVTFQTLGLSKLHEPAGEKPKKVAWETSIPTLRKFLKEEYTDILRLDCAGCEIALMRDILVEDPSFFHHFGQISVKKHAAKAFVETEEDLYYFGIMFPLLEEAGFDIVSSKVVGCKNKYETEDCRPEFNEVRSTDPCFESL